MRDAVAAALAGMARPGLLPVVFADARYGAVLENWLRHAMRAGVAETLVVALDAETEAACRGRPGLGVLGLRHAGTLASLWALRLRLFAVLTRAGVGFVHSDADAVWVADPRPALAALPGDLVFSLGTVWPSAAHVAWGFVLCCGLFAARPGPAVAAFLDGLAAEAEAGQPDDQVLLNHRLLAAGTTWDWSGVPRRERPFRDTVLADPARPLPGACAALGLRLWVLPQAWVPRLPERLPESLVLHPLSPKEPEAKAGLLRGLGAWG